MTAPPAGPLAGLRVVEVVRGTTDLGLGLAGSLPGLLLGDLGAEVTRVTDPTPAPIDAHVTWTRPWQRGKRLERTDEATSIATMLAAADVALVYGPEALVEAQGLGARELLAANPALVHARCRPSRTALGEVEDFGLLVEASAGFCTQLAGHRPGPIFVDVRATGAGTAFLLTTSVLALLHRRALADGVRSRGGGWAETSLYDGMLATLGCMIGRSERAPEGVETYWAKGSWFPNFLYRCSDGELVQIWFGGKGMYPKLLEVLDDEPSENGYYADQATGALNERKERWTAIFEEQPRDVWIERLRAAGVACEPVLAPGEAFADEHVVSTGLAVDHPAPGGGTDRLVHSPIRVAPLDPDAPASFTATVSRAGTPTGLLDGLKVADFSAFVAGPLAAQVLGDLGADVIKVEPTTGEAMRGAAYAIAACQRGKRSLAMDIKAPAARPVIEALIRWADVVLHNFSVGVSERLGIDEASVAQLNPTAVYCHASAFGTDGPRARFPGNDALMQALTGFEHAVGGPGNEPIAATWIPIDMTGGWVAAVGMLAGLCARATTGRGQQVATSLLGAGLLLQSGTYAHDGELVGGPQLDAAQTGYGPGYRLYEAGDGAWFALVVPDPAAWDRLRTLPGADGVTATYTPLRRGPGDEEAQQAETALAALFATAPAEEWLARLRELDVPVAPAGAVDRDAFRRGILDDPVNEQLGRVASYDTADWGHFRQIGRLLRTGPDAVTTTPLHLPRVGDHSLDVLTTLAIDPSLVAQLLESGTVIQHPA